MKNPISTNNLFRVKVDRLADDVTSCDDVTRRQGSMGDIRCHVTRHTVVSSTSNVYWSVPEWGWIADSGEEGGTPAEATASIRRLLRLHRVTVCLYLCLSVSVWLCMALYGVRECPRSYVAYHSDSLMGGKKSKRTTSIDWKVANEHIYTVSHKKRATLFLIITPAFLGRFLYFLYQQKWEEILYNLLI